MEQTKKVVSVYRELLQEYLRSKDEKVLYQAEQFSRQSIQDGVKPEEIIDAHYQTMSEIIPDMDPRLKDSFKFLIETMIYYGVAYGMFNDIKEQQYSLRNEIDVAANMQNTLLKTEIPASEVLDIGAISVPARQMSGDYYHFVQDTEDNIGVAVADVSGKGVPAAFVMSMIKYAMESYPDNRIYPEMILELLNRVVERNVEPGMFVSMFYGLYEVEQHKFYFATAGHEPGFIYRHRSKTFEEIRGKGLLLGVQKDSDYKRFELDIEPNDIIFLLTDGVTECKVSGRFIEQEEVLDVLYNYVHEPPEKLVENVYKHLERLQDFHLRDDFTLVAIQRKDN